jgi:hypothetical protein
VGLAGLIGAARGNGGTYLTASLAPEVLRVQPCHAAGFDGNNLTGVADRSRPIASEAKDHHRPGRGRFPLMISFVANRSRHASTVA